MALHQSSHCALTCVLASLAPLALTAAPAAAGEGAWWRDAVFYQVFVRSFQDADAGPYADDGIGDLQGLIDRLDYINDGDPATSTDLGADALWLLPVFPSPSYHGYDVTDYTGVNPDYGDLELFRRFLAEAHRRGIRVILDFVLNHTSVQHPWFVDAVREDIDSPFRDYFIFAPEELQLAGPWGERCWHYLNGDYFYGVFSSGMPDWNFHDPAVVEHHYNAARFWLEDVGVDGFRLDAVRFFFEDGDVLQDTPETKDWLREFTARARSFNPQAFVIGEAWADTDQVASYVTGGSLDTAFEFDLAKAFIESARFNAIKVFTDRLTRVRAAFDGRPWAAFLSNHDKERTMSQLEGSVAKAKLAASLQLLGEGIPFIYYGEEIGMTGRKPDPDLRTPMQWSAEPHAGFSESEPWRPANADFTATNVALQSADPDSLLSHYRTLIRARKDSPALVHGRPLPLQVDGRTVWAELRATDNELTLLLVNFRNLPTAKWSLSIAGSPLAEGEWSLVNVLGDDPIEPPALDASGGFADWKPFAQLDAETAYLLRWRRAR